MARPGRSGLHGRLAGRAGIGSAAGPGRSGTGFPGPGRWPMEDCGRLPVGQRQGQAAAGRGLRQRVPQQHRRTRKGAARGPGTGGDRAAPGRGVDSGARRRGLHPAGAGIEGLPGELLGRGRGLVGALQRVGSAAERAGDPGIRHLAHERDRVGAVRAERAGADRARPRPADRPLRRQSRRNTGGAGAPGPDQGALRGLGLRGP